MEKPIRAATVTQMNNLSCTKIKNQILSEINEWLESCGQSRPPIDPLRLVGPRKVYDVRREKLGQHGLLIPTPDGFVLKLDSHISRVRQRAIFAHELAHTFFYDISSSPPSKISSLTISAKQEEQWCDEFAGEILMPAKALKKFIAGSGLLGMKTFVRILDEFDVSPEFAAWRLTQTDQWPLITVHLRKREKERETGSGTASSWKWRVFKPSFLKKKSLAISVQSALEELPSPIQCYHGGEDMVVKEEWRLGGKRQTFVVECKRFAGSVPQVIAIFHSLDSETDEHILKPPARRMLL